MSKAFVNIPAATLDLCDTHLLLTPNERLSREYQRAYDLKQLELGRTTWPTLRCMSLPRYLAGELERALDLDPDADLTVLRGHRLFNLFLHHAPIESIELSQAFAAAWQTMHRYDISIDDPTFSSTRGAMFRQWFLEVQQHLPEHVLLEEHLGDYLATHHVAPAAPLLLIEFDQFTQPERRYLAFAKKHVDVLSTDFMSPAAQSWPPAESPTSENRGTADQPQVQGYASLNEELAAAAGWARDTLLTDPQARVGIVVPDLTQHYERAQRQCAAVLDPDAGSLTQTFDLSAGVNLFAQAPWQHARELLRALLDGFDPARCARLGHSPFLALQELAELAQSWPKHLSRSVSLERLAPSLTRTTLPDAGQLAYGQNTFAGWVDHFRNWLHAAGWPQSAQLKTNQYQAVQAIEDALDQYQADPATNTMAAARALTLLDGCLQQQLFAPERPHANILVLGLLETTGLSFTHLWVCGLDENSFPGRSLANPFLPRQLARRHGVPRASQADELHFAQRLLARWQHGADHLRVSYTLSVDDNEQLPSPLLVNVQTLDRAALCHPYLVEPAAKLERFVDNSGSPVARSDLVGGTGLLREQAACPFKAYAQYRLGLTRPLEAGDFPNALVRGNLLHDTLFDLVRRHSSQDALRQVDRATVQAACARVLAAYPQNYPELFSTTEVARLTALILEWLIVEGERQPFEAVYLEESFTLQLGELNFRIRIDRVDQVDDRWVVIDYKSGRVSMSGVTRTPTTDPQLPAYSLVDERIAGAYYAELRDEPRLLGVADEHGALDGARLNKTPYAWTQQRNQWRTDLTRLAESFAAGYAAVDPRPGACDYCHLKSLCRVDDDHEH